MSNFFIPDLETLTTATNLGDSDDWTKGGNGDNILIGGAGSDFAFGGRSRDLLIGGAGSDMLSGLGAEDILIASATIHDGDRDALDSIMAEWVRTDQSYAQRVDHPRNGGGLKGAWLLHDSTIGDDGVPDVVNGGAGRNLLFANRTGRRIVRDMVVARVANEVIVDVGT